MTLVAALTTTVIPVSAAILGAAVAAYRRPGPVVASAIQHFAAGVVFAAAAGEVLPNLKHDASVWPIIIGGGIGIVVMLVFQQLGEHTTGANALLALVGVDLFIDGLVLGLGFAVSSKTGLLLTIALTLEVLFLGLSLAAELGDATVARVRTVALIAGVALLLPVGVVAASAVFQLSPSILTGFFAFGLIALLYLVTEELLVEAHETPDRPWVTALFFIGFLLLGLHGHDHGPSTGPWWQSKKGQLTIACGSALVGAYLIGKLFPSVASYAFIAAMLVGLVPIARRAILAALAGTPFSIEMLMTIAAVGAVIISAGEEAATVVFLFLVGELLEGVAAGKARASIQSLTTLVPKTALLDDNGQIREILADTLEVGAVILVRPGDRIAADGNIVSGESAIDEAPVTGESTPVRKGVDGKVFAGTVNGDAVLRIRVTAAAADNTIARVVKLVEEAQESKAPTERFIDRFSRWYTPGVVIVAALVAVLPPLLFSGAWGEWIYKGLAILLIGCPCALVISTPAAIAASLSNGARRGLLLKGGAVLENLGTISAVAFDKTGTLTEGKSKVTDVIAFTGSEPEVLKFAAALETGSSHPIANAILARAAADKIIVPSATDAKALGGKGITATVDGVEIFFGSPKAANERIAFSSAQSETIATLNGAGKTVSVVIAGNALVGAIAVRDELRADALTGLKLLTDAGIKTVMLTGDNRRTATAIGQHLGIEVRADLLPEDKQRIIGELKSEGFKVAKVGDGINDAPALAAADVGIAMGGGTDVALETADAAVLHGRVGDVAAMIELSKRTMANIRQNIGIALGLKAVFLVTTVIGLTGLWPAILADTGATVLVTLNALRLLRPTKLMSA